MRSIHSVEIRLLPLFWLLLALLLLAPAPGAETPADHRNGAPALAAGSGAVKLPAMGTVGEVGEGGGGLTPAELAKRAEPPAGSAGGAEGEKRGEVATVGKGAVRAGLTPADREKLAGVLAARAARGAAAPAKGPEVVTSHPEAGHELTPAERAKTGARVEGP